MSLLFLNYNGYILKLNFSLKFSKLKYVPASSFQDEISMISKAWVSKKRDIRQESEISSDEQIMWVEWEVDAHTICMALTIAPPPH